MRGYAERQNPLRSAAGFAIVVALHLLLLWALLNGLGHRMIDVIKGPLVTKIIPQVKPPPPKTPPPPPPKLVTPPPPYIPPPIVNVTAPPSPNAITAVVNTPPPAVQSFKPPPTPAAPAIPDSNVAPQAADGSKPSYPDSLIDQDIEGSATIQCTVDANGTTSDCVIAGVTGSSLFGSTALEFCKTRRFRPAYHNGVAVTTRATLPFVFKLTDSQ